MNTAIIFMSFISGVVGVGLETCSYNNKDTCVGNWPCVWCNKTSRINNTGCYKVPLCGLNEEVYESCDYEHKSVYNMTCIMSSTLFIVLIILGYYISMIVIFGTVNKLLLNENIGDNTRKSVNTIIAIMTVVPLMLTFLFKPVTFYFLFCSYLITGCMVYCCVQVKQKRYLVNVDILPPSYTSESVQVDTVTTGTQSDDKQPLLNSDGGNK